jgi:hypothetical protein
MDSSSPDPSLRPVASAHLNLRLQKRALLNKPRSKFDTFYTPENEYFYSMSPYLKLDSRRREIRLLKVFRPRCYWKHIKANPQWAPFEPNWEALQLRATETSTRVPGSHGVVRVDRKSRIKSCSVDQDSPHFACEVHRSHSVDRNSRHLACKVPQSRSVDPNHQLLACELVDKVALSRIDGLYCALSYCAGKPSETRVILVDGLLFNAFASLERAIRLALECWTSRNPGKELLLWADQICINQSDHRERTC